MIHGGTNTRDRCADTVVIGDLVRPDETATVLLDGIEIAVPIGEVNRITIHGRSSRNIVAGCKNPFWVEAVDVGGSDRVLCRLAPAVVQILSNHSPLARSRHT
jgi:hypothetical protein